ncbi:MAG TPA: hypothetical protein VGC77_05445 [Rhodopseudomonas sp.]|uniref:hypothetical protein n=1 Tax=Rhodopseudomonas sp. TaxID=1078 RepID=UPI002EDB92E9
MTYRICFPRAALTALTLSLLGLVAVDSRPAEAAVCGPRGCVGYAAPVARAAVAGPVGVGRVGVGYGRRGVGGYGYGRNMGGPVNRVGRR